MSLTNEQLAVLAKTEKVYADILIRKNMKLVYTIAHQYKFPGVELEDRIQEGAIGMFEAINTYDPEKGNFSTHAVPWIRARIMKYGNEQSNIIRLPANAVSLRVKVLSYIQTMMKTKGIRPTIEQIAEALGDTVEHVRHIIMINDSTIPASLDTTAQNSDGDEVNAHELVGGKMLESDILQEDRMKRLLSLVNNMNSTSRYIASRVLGLNGFTTQTYREMDQLVFDEEGNRLSFTAVNMRYLEIEKRLTRAFAAEQPLFPMVKNPLQPVVVVVSKHLKKVYVTAHPSLAEVRTNVKSILQNLPDIGDVIRQDFHCACVTMGEYSKGSVMAELEKCVEDAWDLAEEFDGEVICHELSAEFA